MTEVLVSLKGTKFLLWGGANSRGAVRAGGPGPEAAAWKRGPSAPPQKPGRGRGLGLQGCLRPWRARVGLFSTCSPLPGPPAAAGHDPKTSRLGSTWKTLWLTLVMVHMAGSNTCAGAVLKSYHLILNESAKAPTCLLVGKNVHEMSNLVLM